MLPRQERLRRLKISVEDAAQRLRRFSEENARLRREVDRLTEENGKLHLEVRRSRAWAERRGRIRARIENLSRRLDKALEAF
jgi:regulator of replication initiation timing